MKFLLQLLFALLLSGCVSVETHKDSSSNLSHIRTVFVERRLGDDHHIDQAITDELLALGLEVTNGAPTMRPDRVDAIVSYADRWEWDFKSYLIELNVSIRDGITDKGLAQISYYRPSIFNKTPAVALHELLPPLFKNNRAVKTKSLIAPLRDTTKSDRQRASASDAKP